MYFMPSTRPAGHQLRDQRSCCRCDSNNELKQKRRKLSGEIPKYISLFPISLSVSLTAGLQDFLFISVLVQVSEARIVTVCLQFGIPKEEYTPALLFLGVF